MIEGIKKAYPHIPLPKKVRAIVQLVRPFTIFPVLVVVLCGVWIQKPLLPNLGVAILSALAIEVRDPTEQEKINFEALRSV